MNEQHGFARIIGQADAVNRLRAFAELHRNKGRTLGHVLLVGPDGHGKRLIAHALADECGVNIRTTEGSAMERPGDLAGILTNLSAHDILLVPNVNRIGRSVREIFTRAVSAFQLDVIIGQGPSERSIALDLKPFTLIGTVRKEAECSPEVHECFPLVLPLAKYSQVELEQIVQARTLAKGITITAPTARLIANLANGSPRNVDALVQRLTLVDGSPVTEEAATGILSTFGFRVVSSDKSGIPDDLDDLSGVDFERLVTSLLERMGLHPTMTKASGDGGVDIIAVLDRPVIGGKYLVQCKRLAPDKMVGSATVREFYGAVVADRSAIKGILVTTSGFSDQAREFAKELPLELIDGTRLRSLLSEYAPIPQAE